MVAAQMREKRLSCWDRAGQNLTYGRRLSCRYIDRVRSGGFSSHHPLPVVEEGMLIGVP